MYILCVHFKQGSYFRTFKCKSALLYGRLHFPKVALFLHFFGQKCENSKWNERESKIHTHLITNLSFTSFSVILPAFCIYFTLHRDCVCSYAICNILLNLYRLFKSQFYQTAPNCDSLFYPIEWNPCSITRFALYRSRGP